MLVNDDTDNNADDDIDLKWLFEDFNLGTQICKDKKIDAIDKICSSAQQQ